MLFSATIKNISEWKAVSNAISELVEDAIFIVNNEKLTFRGMDKSNMALLDITFPKKSFIKFVGKKMWFAMKINDLKLILNNISNDDVIEFNIAKKTKMNVSVHGTLKMNYEIKLIQREKPNLSIPNSDYQSKISIEPTILSQIVTKLQAVSDHIIIECDSNRVEFSGKGKAGEAKINMDKNNPELKYIHSKNVSHCSYNLEYMAKIVREIGTASKKINFEYGDENPVHFLFDLPSKTQINYYLAPNPKN